MGLLPKYTVPDDDAVKQYRTQRDITSDYIMETKGDCVVPQTLEQYQQLELSEDEIPEDLKEMRASLIQSSIKRQRTHIHAYSCLFILSIILMALSLAYSNYVLALAMVCQILASSIIIDHSRSSRKILSKALKSYSVNLMEYDLAQPSLSRYLIVLASFLITMSLVLTMIK